MPWQRLVADVGLELMPDGTPAYREVVVTVPRQNGKTTLMLAFEIQRAIGWGHSQQIAYTAQTGKDAREKLLNDQVPLLTARTSDVRHGIDRVLRGVGNEAVTFKTGSRIFVLNSGEDSGHGKTLDLGVIDESFADEDDRREQAMLPAMLTRPMAQVLNISTAGTDRSPFLRRKVDTGRAAVANGETHGIAYFEWSAEDDADIENPDTWASCMPALGYTITESTVRHMRQTMTEGEFRRAGLNLWTSADERVIPAVLWNAICDTDITPDGDLTIGIDVNPERSAASVCMADPSGRVELVEQSAGVGWVVDRVGALAKRWDAGVVLDTLGPAGSLAGELEAVGVSVHGYGARDMAQACGAFFDAVADRRVRIRRHPALDEAAAGARRRQLSDTWIWGRRDSGADIAPLIAATIAYDRATRAETGGVWAAWG